MLSFLAGSLHHSVCCLTGTPYMYVIGKLGTHAVQDWAASAKGIQKMHCGRSYCLACELAQWHCRQTSGCWLPAISALISRTGPMMC